MPTETIFHKVVYLFRWLFGRRWSIFFPAKWARVSLPKTPVIALFLAASWIHNGIGIKEMGNYIRDQIESTVGEDIIGWEHRARSRRKPLGGLGLSFLSAVGVFIGTSLLAILIALPLAKFNTIEILSFISATISIISSVVLFRYYRSSSKQ